MAERIHANPALERDAILGEIFAENRDLYRRYREETTMTTHGETLAASYRRSRGSFGVDQYGREVTTSSQDVATEVMQKATLLMVKSSEAPQTIDDAIGLVFQREPQLYRAYRARSYA